MDVARVRGEGPVPVVFENGAGSPCWLWRAVEEQLGEEVTTVAYDRAGIGWSDAAPIPRSGSAIVEDLRLLLETVSVPLPVVLVAHSAGALYARLFQAAHSEAVAGVVFVDGVDGHTYREGRRELRSYERAIAVAHQRVVPPLVVLADRIGLVGAVARRTAPDPVTAADPDLLEARRLFWSGRNCLAGSRAESRHLDDTAEQVSQLGPLGDLPVAVVRAGESSGLFTRIQQSWTDTQRRLAGLSTRSELITADGAGHFVQTDRPDLVADASRRVLEVASS